MLNPNIKQETQQVPKILIVEDNPISRKVLSITLQSADYSVVAVNDGASALQQASNQVFDLIIQDLLLPDMDGFALNEALRKLPNVKEIPIFVLSGFINAIEEQEKYSGVTQFLLKPIQPSYLLEVIKAHLPISKPTEVAIGKGNHILIADDNPIQLKLISMQLRNMGFEVTTAVDGVMALNAAKNKHPDVIVSDILMPNMDGFGLCIEIKKDPLLCAIPVMLLTSHYLEQEDHLLAKKVGASCYLTRTPDVNKLITELLKVINKEISPLVNEPVDLSEDIKKKHIIRSIRQLEQQVMDNAKLTRRCAILGSQLSLISGMTNALTKSKQNLSRSYRHLLYFCLDATGVSKGALYMWDKNKNMALVIQVGFEEQKEILTSFFNLSDIMPEIIQKNNSIIVPSHALIEKITKKLLEEIKVKSAAIVPLHSYNECLGILFLGSDHAHIINENSIEFIDALGLQLGQSIALALAFKNLASSETRYRQLVEISPEAILIKQDRKFVYANSAAFKLLNAVSLNELAGVSFYDFFPAECHAEIKNHIKKSKDTFSVSEIECGMLNLKGDHLDVEIVISPFYYQKRSALYMIIRDITQRKRSALHLEIQYAIAWILAESQTLFISTGKILQIICERLQWDCGIIWAVDKESKVLRCTRIWQTPKITNEKFTEMNEAFQFPIGVGLAGRVWQHQKAIWTSDINQRSDFVRKKHTEAMGLITQVAFPIFYENEILGIMEFFSTKSLKPDPEVLLWFESIGNQFGTFLMRKHMEKQMLYLAEHDVLTGLSNRSLLEQSLTTAMKTAAETQQKLAVLFLDLDHFKYVNDSMGHPAGDQLLKEISDRFRQCLKPQDTICRLGGDEFIIIIPEIQNKEEVVEVISKLQKQLSSQIFLRERELSITASIGISLYPEDGDSVQALIKGADIAMYAAKEQGRNTFQFCSPEMTLKAENRGTLQNNLSQALENNEFILYYQPKISVATKKIIGMEALIRWQRKEGILLPGSFIAAVESSDLIIPIGEWVLQTAYAQNILWKNANLPPVTMSVNLSARNLNNQLLYTVEKILAKTNHPPHLFEVELTESALVENVENNIQVLRSLKEMGLKISIDDFGTGYSSLSYLKRFPIDTIKIDQSFVRDIATDPDDAAIVIAIIAMSHSLGFTVIAEGVETKEQLKFLCQHGCDEIQGYYFSRPLSLIDATHFIENANIQWDFD